MEVQHTTQPSLLCIRFLAPRFWLTWLLLGIMWLIAQLPYRAQRVLGNILGRMMQALRNATADVEAARQWARIRRALGLS